MYRIVIGNLDDDGLMTTGVIVREFRTGEYAEARELMQDISYIVPTIVVMMMRGTTFVCCTHGGEWSYAH